MVAQYLSTGILNFLWSLFILFTMIMFLLLLPNKK